MYSRRLSVTFIVNMSSLVLLRVWEYKRVHLLLIVQGACQPKNQKVATCTFGK